MTKYAFIILHYNSIEETNKCIESIFVLKGTTDGIVQIIVVDNASPNGTGSVLEERYKDVENVTVILRNQNDGFSMGNNVGIRYAHDKFNPDYYIVANNDIQFIQSNTLDLIEVEYANSRFDCLGPDIYVPIKDIHQSPISATAPTKLQAIKTIVLNAVMLRAYGIFRNRMRLYFRRHLSASTGMDYKKYQENVCVSGACMIFSKECVTKKISTNEDRSFFYPVTTFYYEEFIFTKWCQYNNRKIVYQPAIIVHHTDGATTELSSENEDARNLFKMKHICEAAKVYYHE